MLNALQAHRYEDAIRLLKEAPVTTWRPLLQQQPDLWFRAVNTGNVPLVEMLLSYGYAVNMRSSQGDTALSLATDRLDIPMMQLLLQEGADHTLQGSNTKPPLAQVLRYLKSPHVFLNAHPAPPPHGFQAHLKLAVASLFSLTPGIVAQELQIVARAMEAFTLLLGKGARLDSSDLQEKFLLTSKRRLSYYEEHLSMKHKAFAAIGAVSTWVGYQGYESYKANALFSRDTPPYLTRAVSLLATLIIPSTLIAILRDYQQQSQSLQEWKVLLTDFIQHLPEDRMLALSQNASAPSYKQTVAHAQDQYQQQALPLSTWQKKCQRIYQTHAMLRHKTAEAGEQGIISLPQEIINHVTQYTQAAEGFPARHSPKAKIVGDQIEIIHRLSAIFSAKEHHTITRYAKETVQNMGITGQKASQLYEEVCTSSLWNIAATYHLWPSTFITHAPFQKLWTDAAQVPSVEGKNQLRAFTTRLQGLAIAVEKEGIPDVLMAHSANRITPLPSDIWDHLSCYLKKVADRQHPSKKLTEAEYATCIKGYLANPELCRQLQARLEGCKTATGTLIPERVAQMRPLQFHGVLRQESAHSLS